MKILVYTLAFVIATVLRGEVRELADPTGTCVQVAIDFNIEKFETALDGKMQFTVCTSDSELGLKVVIDKLKKSQMPVYGGGEISIMKTRFEFHSLGEPTARLEHLIIKTLQIDNQGREEPYRILGSYPAFTSCPYGFSGVMVLHASGLMAFSYDKNDKETSGTYFNAELVIDAPMKRMTAYFSIPGGYGGVAPADRARSKWLEQTKIPNP